MIPKKIILLAILVFIICAYPVVLITPYFPASADAAATIATRVINSGAFDWTYRPYSDIGFTYQIGFPLFALFFINLIPIPDYLIVWLLGCIFASLQLIGIYLFAREFFKSEKVAEWCAVLFVGTKLIYENTYVGEYAWLMASALMLFFLYALLKESNWAYPLFPAIFVVHPAVAFNTLIFLFIYALFFKLSLKRIFYFSLSLILAVPFAWLTYLTILQSSSNISLNIGELIPLILIIPAWIGLIPAAFAFFLFLHHLLKRAEFSKHQKFLMALFCFSLLAFFGSFIIGSILHGRIIELMAFAAVFLGGSLIERKTNISLSKILVVGFCIFIILNSGILNHYRGGSKITMEEAEFAVIFREFDPGPARTLFLTGSSGKMAEFSNKIAYDINSAYQISTLNYSHLRDEAWGEVEKKHRIKGQIIETGCTNRIYGLGVDYVVINKDFFPCEMKEMPILNWGRFELYWVRK